jgi:UrcA family protein
MENVIKTRFNLAKFIVAASFVGLSATAVSGVALAQSATGPASMRANAAYPVRYSDRDVSTVKGAKTLYLRIRYGAETLCASAATWGNREGQACMSKAITDAVARVNSPLLTQYAQLRSKTDNTGFVQLAKAN